MRKLAGVVLGVLVAAGAAYGLQLVNRDLFLPTGTDLRDIAALADAPMTAKAMVVGGWFLGALAGGLIAVRIAGGAGAGWIVALLVACSALGACLHWLPAELSLQIAAVAAPLFAGLVVSGASGAA
jgi:hypothetical protein